MSKALLRVSQVALPLTPVDTGNLRRSMRRRVFSTAGIIWGVIWYESDYAIYVHEVKVRTWKIVIPVSKWASRKWGTRRSKSGMYRQRAIGKRLPGEQGHRPPTQWKFLEEALKRTRHELLAIIRAEAKVK